MKEKSFSSLDKHIKRVFGLKRRAVNLSEEGVLHIRGIKEVGQLVVIIALLQERKSIETPLELTSIIWDVGRLDSIDGKPAIVDLSATLELLKLVRYQKLILGLDNWKLLSSSLFEMHSKPIVEGASDKGEADSLVEGASDKEEADSLEIRVVGNGLAGLDEGKVGGLCEGKVKLVVGRMKFPDLLKAYDSIVPFMSSTRFEVIAMDPPLSLGKKALTETSEYKECVENIKLDLCKPYDRRMVIPACQEILQSAASPKAKASAVRKISNIVNAMLVEPASKLPIEMINFLHWFQIRGIKYFVDLIIKDYHPDVIKGNLNNILAVLAHLTIESEGSHLEKIFEMAYGDNLTKNKTVAQKLLKRSIWMMCNIVPSLLIDECVDIFKVVNALANFSIKFVSNKRISDIMTMREKRGTVIESLIVFLRRIRYRKTVYMHTVSGRCFDFLAQCLQSVSRKMRWKIISDPDEGYIVIKIILSEPYYFRENKSKNLLQYINFVETFLNGFTSEMMCYLLSEKSYIKILISNLFAILLCGITAGYGEIAEGGLFPGALEYIRFVKKIAERLKGDKIKCFINAPFKKGLGLKFVSVFIAQFCENVRTRGVLNEEVELLDLLLKSYSKDEIGALFTERPHDFLAKTGGKANLYEHMMHALMVLIKKNISIKAKQLEIKAEPVSLWSKVVSRITLAINKGRLVEIGEGSGRDKLIGNLNLVFVDLEGMLRYTKSKNCCAIAENLLKINSRILSVLSGDRLKTVMKDKGFCTVEESSKGGYQLLLRDIITHWKRENKFNQVAGPIFIILRVLLDSLARRPEGRLINPLGAEIKAAVEGLAALKDESCIQQCLFDLPYTFLEAEPTLFEYLLTHDHGEGYGKVVKKLVVRVLRMPGIETKLLRESVCKDASKKYYKFPILQSLVAYIRKTKDKDIVRLLFPIMNAASDRSAIVKEVFAYYSPARELELIAELISLFMKETHPAREALVGLLCEFYRQTPSIQLEATFDKEPISFFAPLCIEPSEETKYVAVLRNCFMNDVVYQEKRFASDKNYHDAITFIYLRSDDECKLHKKNILHFIGVILTKKRLTIYAVDLLFNLCKRPISKAYRLSLATCVREAVKSNPSLLLEMHESINSKDFIDTERKYLKFYNLVLRGLDPYIMLKKDKSKVIYVIDLLIDNLRNQMAPRSSDDSSFSLALKTLCLSLSKSSAPLMKMPKFSDLDDLLLSLPADKIKANIILLFKMTSDRIPFVHPVLALLPQLYFLSSKKAKAKVKVKVKGIRKFSWSLLVHAFKLNPLLLFDSKISIDGMPAKPIVLCLSNMMLNNSDRIVDKKSRYMRLASLVTQSVYLNPPKPKKSAGKRVLKAHGAKRRLKKFTTNEGSQLLLCFAELYFKFPDKAEKKAVDDVKEGCLNSIIALLVYLVKSDDFLKSLMSLASSKKSPIKMLLNATKNPASETLKKIIYVDLLSRVAQRIKLAKRDPRKCSVVKKQLLTLFMDELNPLASPMTCILKKYSAYYQTAHRDDTAAFFGISKEKGFLIFKEIFSILTPAQLVKYKEAVKSNTCVASFVKEALVFDPDKKSSSAPAESVLGLIEIDSSFLTPSSRMPERLPICANNMKANTLGIIILFLKFLSAKYDAKLDKLPRLRLHVKLQLLLLLLHLPVFSSLAAAYPFNNKKITQKLDAARPALFKFYNTYRDKLIESDHKIDLSPLHSLSFSYDYALLSKWHSAFESHLRTRHKEILKRWDLSSYKTAGTFFDKRGSSAYNKDSLKSLLAEIACTYWPGLLPMSLLSEYALSKVAKHKSVLSAAGDRPTRDGSPSASAASDISDVDMKFLLGSGGRKSRRRRR